MRQQVGFFDVYAETLGKLSGKGILLLAGDPPNPMTIGWGTIGYIWNKPVFTVLVRPVRYTFELMEKSADFTVCGMPEGFNKQLALCGTKSGREMDKVAACGFTMERGIGTSTPFIGESEFHYECRILHKHRLDPDHLDFAVNNRYYPGNDWHMVYYGEILGVYRKLHPDT
jgi:flavin reductase (DIM6/NTAB) family NADH-FMN oxidoreductase RutF